MESNQDPREALAATERAAVAPWIEQPAPPWWYIPSLGLLMGGLVLVLGERESMPYALSIISAVAVTSLIGVWIGAVIRHQGVVPRLRSAPPEFVPAIRAYLAGYFLLLALVVTVYFVIDSRVAAVIAAVGTWVGLYVYEKRYEAAADAVRERMA